MSARPTRRRIGSDQKSWDADTEANFRQMLDVALPLPEFASTGDLPDADLYRGCMAAVGSSSGLSKLVISDGTDWREIALGSAV